MRVISTAWMIALSIIFLVGLLALTIATNVFWVSELEMWLSQAINTTVEQVLLIGSAAVAAPLALAHYRFRCFIQEKERLLEVQAKEIDFQRDALKAHAIVTVSDSAGKIIDMNDGFRDVFGYERFEVIDRTHGFIFGDQEEDPVFIAIRDATAKGQIWSGEHAARAKDGKVVILQGTVVPLHDRNGKHLKSLSMRTDVTKLRKLEAERYLTTLLQNLPDDVVVHSVADLAITYLNQSALDAQNWTLEEARAHRISDVFDAFDEDCYRMRMAPLMSGAREFIVCETAINGVPVEVVTRVFVGHDYIPVFISVIRNIEERKQAELEKLESVSIVTHELRTPLTSIKGALRLLQAGTGGELGPDATSIVDIAQRNSERMLLIVNDILDLKKLQSGKMEFAISPVDLSQLVHEAVDANRGYAGDFGVSLDFVDTQEETLVFGDANRLMQVMSNLLSNAAKFSPKDGRISVKIKDTNAFWRVSVKDSGPGIPDEFRETVFKSFSQINAADGRKRKGTGLGLAISKEIVDRHNGHLDFESAPDEGTTFFVDLPKRNSAKTTEGPLKVAC